MDHFPAPVLQLNPDATEALKTERRASDSARGLKGTFLHLSVIVVATIVFLYGMQIRSDLAVGWVDSAIYHALFMDSERLLKRFGDIYFAARWPWVLLGTQVFASFAHPFASYIFSLIVLTIIGCLTYGFARAFVSPNAAVGVAVIASCNLQVAQTVVSGYPSSAAAALLFCGVAIAKSGYENDSRWRMIFAGFLYGLAGVTHQFAIAIGIFAHFSVMIGFSRGLTWRRLIARDLWLTAGALIIVPVSALAFSSYGLSLSAVKPVFETGRRSLFQAQGSYFQKTYDQLLLDAGVYIILLTAFLIVLNSVRAWWRFESPSKRTWLAHLVFVVPFFALMFYDLVLGGATLQYGFYQVFLYPPAILQLGVLLDKNINGNRPATCKLSSILLVVYFGFLAGTLALLDGNMKLSFLSLTLLTIWTVVIIMCWRLKGTSFTRPVAIVLIVVAALSSNITRFSIPVHASGQTGSPGIETLAWALQQASRYAQPTMPLLFAYDRTDVVLAPSEPIVNDRWPFTFAGKRSYFTIFDTIAGASLWERGMVSTSKADLTIDVAHRLTRYGPVPLLILWMSEDGTHRILTALGSHGLVSEERERGIFEAGRFKFHYAIFMVQQPRINQ